MIHDVRLIMAFEDIYLPFWVHGGPSLVIEGGWEMSSGLTAFLLEEASLFVS